MKKIFCLWILIFTFNIFSNISVEDKINNANNLFKNNSFEEAAEIYKELIESGYNNDALNYNLGNCYYKLGKIGLAILHYERALLLNPNDEDIIHNLEFTRTRLSNKIEEVPRFFLFEWWDNTINLFSLNSWIMVSFIFFLFVLIFLTSLISGRFTKYSRLIFMLLFTFVIFLFFGLSASIGKYYQLNNRNYGIILLTNVNVKNAPNEKSKDSFIINEGIKVKLEDKVDNWIKIKLADGKVGWVLENEVERI